MQTIYSQGKKSTFPWRCAQISFRNEWKRQYKNVVQCVREGWEFTSLVQVCTFQSTPLNQSILLSKGLQKQRCPEKLNFSEIIYNAFAVVYQCLM